jgi:aspartokinase
MSATQDVFKILVQDVAINKGLINGIVNTRALAKFLRKKYELKYTEEALVSAIRRYDPVLAKGEEITNALEHATLFGKSNISCLTTNTKDQAKIGKILQDETLNKNIRLSRAKKYTKFIVYNKEVENLKSHFLEDQIISIDKNLFEIRILLEGDPRNIVGILSNISSQVTFYNIAIQEFILSGSEILVYVKEMDGLKAQEALMERFGNKTP